MWSNVVVTRLGEERIVDTAREYTPDECNPLIACRMREDGHWRLTHDLDLGEERTRVVVAVLNLPGILLKNGGWAVDRVKVMNILMGNAHE
jgi:hypothetical protein